MDHPTLDVTALSPEQSRSPYKSPSESPWLERHVGQTVAAAAATIGVAFAEFQDGGLTSTTKGRGGTAIFELYRLRQFLVADFPNFEDLARREGIAALRQLCGNELSSAAIDVLVDEALSILAKIVKMELN